MRQSKRRFLSLIEIMIVMSLLAMLAGVVAISVTRAVKDETYHAGVAKLVDRLQLAQNIMLLLNGDVQAQLAQEKEGLYCHLDVSQGLIPLLKRIVDESGVIPGIGGFLWKPQIGTEITNAPVVLNFKSGGTNVSVGELTVSSGAISELDGRRNYILLTGLAEPISASTRSEFDRLKESPTTSDRLYPTEVREYFENRKKG